MNLRETNLYKINNQYTKSEFLNLLEFYSQNSPYKYKSYFFELSFIYKYVYEADINLESFLKDRGACNWYYKIFIDFLKDEVKKDNENKIFYNFLISLYYINMNFVFGISTLRVAN